MHTSFDINILLLVMSPKETKHECIKDTGIRMFINELHQIVKCSAMRESKCLVICQRLNYRTATQCNTVPDFKMIDCKGIF